MKRKGKGSLPLTFLRRRGRHLGCRSLRRGAFDRSPRSATGDGASFSRDRAATPSLPSINLSTKGGLSFSLSLTHSLLSKKKERNKRERERERLVVVAAKESDERRTGRQGDQEKVESSKDLYFTELPSGVLILTELWFSFMLSKQHICPCKFQISTYHNK